MKEAVLEGGLDMQAGKSNFRGKRGIGGGRIDDVYRSPIERLMSGRFNNFAFDKHASAIEGE